MALARSTSSAKAQSRTAAARPLVAPRPAIASIQHAAVASATAVRAAPAASMLASTRAQSSALRAAAAPAAASTSSQTENKTWTAVVANAEFMLNDVQNESMAEQLRERVRFFNEQNRERDFYLVVNPTWLDAKFPQQAKQIARPCVALVSTDKMWITYMKLRLDRVLKFDLADLSKEEVIASASNNELPEFKQPLGTGKWTAPYPRYAAGWWKVFFPNSK